MSLPFACRCPWCAAAVLAAIVLLGAWASWRIGMWMFGGAS